jgi:hypothetical protein
MTDEPDPPTPVVKLVPPPFDPMKERGARPPDPPPERSSPTSRLNAVEIGELAEIVARVITVRGGRKENLVPHWIAADALRIIDPYRQAPPLAQMAARILLRDLAEEEMAAYRPPPDALNMIAEAEEAEAIDVRRRAAEEAEAHRLSCIPFTCGLCGKPCAEERPSLILGTTPKTRICEPCIGAAVVNELDRHHRRAAAEEVRKLEAESVGVARSQLRSWDRELGNIERRPRRPKGEP